MMHEHDGPGPKVGRRIQKGEEPLVQCLRGIGGCSKLAYEAATRIMSIRRMTALHYATASLLQGKRRFATCAVVGNAGHTLNHKLGKFIDKHEAVIRFNVMATDGYYEHVGKRTTHRMLNHGRSITGCCRSKLPENSTHHAPITVLLWHPGGQDEIASECRTRYPANAVLGLQRPVIGRMVAIMKALRMDMARLGFGPMSSWRQMTSGAHAVLLFERLCDTVSLYGMTAYPSKGPDQYAGRDKKSSSGRQWHDWTGESLTWRLMHAGGRAALCSA